MENNNVEFECFVNRCMYDSPDFRIYSTEIDQRKYPDIKLNNYGNVSILGNIHQLNLLQLYTVTAVEELGKYGIQYRVKTIKQDKPKNENDVYAFLQEILTFNQASELWKNYPDIVDRVINNNLDDVDLKKLKGIGEKTFERIKKKIIDNYALYDLVVDFGGLITMNMIQKIYEKYPSVESLKEKLKISPYECLTKLSGVGFIKADTILLELEKNERIKFGYDLKTSPHRCLACMEYLLKKNEEEGNTKMDLRDLRSEAIKLVPACAEHFVKCLKAESIFYDKNTYDVALNDTYIKELYIAQNISHGLQNNNVWDIDWSKYTKTDEYELTSEQSKALKMVCEKNIMIINGFAGAGKSLTSSAIIKMLEDNNKSYMLFAPTGRAAKVLSDYTNRPASTIHRGLGYMPPLWMYNQECKLLCDVLLIDEFSMTDVDLFTHVIDAINFNKTKLILVGDSAQLPSVGAGNLLHDFIKSDIIPTVTLNHIFRYSEGGLMKVATDVRNCKQYLFEINSKMTPFGSGDYVFIQSSNQNIVRDLLAVYKRLINSGNSPEDIQILSSYNKGDYGTIVINNKLHAIANKKVGKKGNSYMKIGDECFYVDDIVIQKKNNYHAKVYVDDEFEFSDDDDLKETFVPNGMIGKVISIKGKFIVIEFDGILVRYMKEDMLDVKLAYSISTHSSQGGSAKIIILLTPSAHTFMLNSNLIYVGLTRMKQQCYHIGDAVTVNRAIRKKENFDRKTFMEDFLKKIGENNKNTIDKVD